MNAQSRRLKPGNTSGDQRLPSEPIRERTTERAFVIQFEPIEGARSRLRGRVELVASGEATRFRSRKQLVGFMVDILRRRAAAEPRS
jgi:hypothetical protein